MRKALLILTVLLMMMSFASSASARALGHGIIFEEIVSDGTGSNSSKPFPGKGNPFK